MTEYKKIFFDTAPIVYYLEKDDHYFAKVSAFIKQNANVQFITSAITITEYSVIPYRINKPELIHKLRSYIDISKTDIISIDHHIADKAAQIRAAYKAFKTMDALQLATAVISGCDAFLSNDRQLRQFDEIQCLLVEDL